MAIKKSELYSSLWAGCDEIRGGMDASQYKDYVLVLLFMKSISDKFAGQPYAPIEGWCRLPQDGRIIPALSIFDQLHGFLDLLVVLRAINPFKHLERPLQFITRA